MFTNWKGRRPGGHDSLSSSSIASSASNPSSAFPTSSNNSTISHPTTSFSSFSPSLSHSPQFSGSGGGVFGAPINPASEGPPLLGKLIRFLQTKSMVFVYFLMLQDNYFYFYAKTKRNEFFNFLT
jgi:hypothetical protein